MNQSHCLLIKTYQSRFLWMFNTYQMHVHNTKLIQSYNYSFRLKSSKRSHFTMKMPYKLLWAKLAETVKTCASSKQSLWNTRLSSIKYQQQSIKLQDKDLTNYFQQAITILTKLRAGGSVFDNTIFIGAFLNWIFSNKGFDMAKMICGINRNDINFVKNIVFANKFKVLDSKKTKKVKNKEERSEIMKMIGGNKGNNCGDRKKQQSQQRD